MKRNLDLWMIGTMSAITLVSTSPQFRMNSPGVTPTVSTMQHLETVVPLRPLEPLSMPHNVRQMDRSLLALEIRNHEAIAHAHFVAVADTRHHDSLERLHDKLERASERVERRSKVLSERIEFRSKVLANRYEDGSKSYADHMEYRSRSCADRWEARMRMLGDRLEAAVNRVALRLEYAFLKIEAAISRVHL
jgi:hypothetical protein